MDKIDGGEIMLDMKEAYNNIIDFLTQNDLLTECCVFYTDGVKQTYNTLQMKTLLMQDEQQIILSYAYGNACNFIIDTLKNKTHNDMKFGVTRANDNPYVFKLITLIKDGDRYVGVLGFEKLLKYVLPFEGKIDRYITDRYGQFNVVVTIKVKDKYIPITSDPHIKHYETEDEATQYGKAELQKEL